MVKNLIKDTNTFDITKPPSHEKASVGKPIIKAREILDEHLPTNALGEKADLTSLDEELSAFKLESVTRIALIYQNSLSDLSDLSDLPSIPVKLTKSLYSDPSRPRMFAKELSKDPAANLCLDASIAEIGKQNSLPDRIPLAPYLTPELLSTKALNVFFGHRDPSRARMFAKELNKEKYFIPTKDGVELGDSFPQFPLCELQKNITDWVQQAREDVK